MKTKIQIKSIEGEVLFELEKENNTLKDTIEEGLKLNISFKNANLRYADLQGANLNEADLRHADLSNADLKGASLSNADFNGARLCDIDFKHANLSGSDLYLADLRGADLSNSSLYGADLRYANLQGANLNEADLCHADLSNADLKGASLSNADFNGAKNVPYIPLHCPSEGSFIGWKKVSGKLIKLEIPEDARRSSATSMKCRCDKAKVLAITDLDGSNPIDSIVNDAYSHVVTYKVGEIVYPDFFDENRWEECSHGIHFFANKQDAINY